MSAIVKTAIASELASLVQIVDFPTAPHGYGSDISCDSDVDPTAREVDGFSTLALAEALVRRLDTPRGSLPDDKNYGISITSYLNRGATAADLRQLAGQIRAELALDDRVASLTVRVAPNGVGSNLSIEIATKPIDPNLATFTLTLNASNAGLVLEEIEGAL